ncbi:MAG: twin-arginine translocase TatA/TatE family subunit [Planctomycetaceae bacterium]|jgi:sec-independent protein translocase protein TatA|nr:twin-arginine translocase TatA/TatE family subunit [Planctomycetaceae bacterium]
MSPSTVIVILLLGVLLFGGRLPEIARDIGKGFLEFQHGMNEWSREAKKTVFDENSSSSSGSAKPAEDSIPTTKADVQETSAPKFEPPPEE